MKEQTMLRLGMVLTLSLAFPRYGRADYSVGTSTTAKKLIADLEEVSKEDQMPRDNFFDSSASRRGDAQPVFVQVQTMSKPGLVQAQALTFQNPGAVKALSTLPVPPLKTVAGEPAKKQCCLDQLQSTEDGNLYRMRSDRPWWKLWDSSKVIEKASPGKGGSLYNDKDEFVGQWQKVMSTKANKFQPVKGEGGVDNIYTFQNKGNGTEISRNGKSLTTFAQSALASNLAELKVGANNQVYARYSKEAEDVILTLDPTGSKQVLAAKVPAELKTSETQVDRTGVRRFEVTKDGRVLTLFKGNVFEEKAVGQREMLAGNKSAVSPLENAPRGNISDFAVDARGNLYLVKDGRIAVGDGAVGTIEQNGSRNIIVDNNGNVMNWTFAKLN